MQEFIKNLKCDYWEKASALINKGVSFAFSGITNCSKLIILAQMAIKNNKKIVFVTETEQTALKFQNDLNKLFNLNAVIFPYQDGSIYDTNSKNLYKYAKQAEILLNQDKYNIIIIPQKALFEKFPIASFYEDNSIEIKVNDDINTEELAKNLIKLGYKRRTLVADVGEFSIRGDIIDIYSLEERPFRIELWGDTVTDIRTFDNTTQRSIEKTDNIKIFPIYKFILNKNSFK